ncbi:hypothetical protein EJ07DRAFT_152273 [Lizonia empirigonia]|nr:hypothetical protein EJ07DRAFT_152273 [Lizonia empirigonia]
MQMQMQIYTPRFSAPIRFSWARAWEGRGYGRECRGYGVGGLLVGGAGAGAGAGVSGLVGKAEAAAEAPNVRLVYFVNPEHRAYGSLECRHRPREWNMLRYDIPSTRPPAQAPARPGVHAVPAAQRRVRCVPARRVQRRRRVGREAVEAVDRETVVGEEEKEGAREGVREEDVKSESETLGQVKSFWDAMHQHPQPSTFHGPEKPSTNNAFDPPPFDKLSKPVVVKVWRQLYEPDHNHLFGRPKTNIPLSALHPPHVHIFRLWQVYCDNLSPLLRVTHAQMLQAQILDAAGEVAGMGRELEARMFGVYCAAVMRLGEEECRGVLGRRRWGCWAGFSRADTHPHTLSPMFAVAFRIANRMNIDSEAANAKHGVFEAEMRRRLWWAMVVYDSRISEMSDYKTTQLVPTWDCKIPVNVNDFDLRPEMTTRPTD